MVEIKHCSTDSDFFSAIQITKDYIRWLNMDLSFQDIDKELSDFPSMYGHPNGLFLLAWHRRKPNLLSPIINELKLLIIALHI